MTPIPSAPVEAPTPVRPTTAFRPDIEGLRAVAVVLVVAFHAGVPLVQGGYVGVDVFFVISGFLITGLLVSELDRSERLSISGFYARRIRRLLPLSTLVLVATAVGSVLVLPALVRPEVAGDIRSAALWFSNIHFAAESTAYMSAVEQSPVLQFWSLSVEEQFYVVWPLLIVLVGGTVAIGVGRQDARRARLLVALGALFGVSLALSVLTSASDGPWAYFGLHTRAWELAAGGLLAIVVARAAAMPRIVAVLSGYVGLALVVASALMFTRATTFPGYAALVPVGGTVLLLAAGARSQAGVARMLSTRPMMYVGRISYGWYLWHWPLLVFATAVWGGAVDESDPEALGAAAPQHGPWPVIGAVVASFLLASLTYRLVEQPARRSRALAESKGLTFALGAALLVVAVALPTYLLGSASPFSRTPAVLADRASTAASGAVVVNLPNVPLAMTPAEAKADNAAPDRCDQQVEQTTVDPSCRFGAAGGPVVALVGDSHAAHWFPALERIAEERGWQLLFWTKAACGVADVRTYSPALKREYTECQQWRDAVVAQLESEPRVDAIIVGRSSSYPVLVLDDTGERPGREAGARLWGAGAAAMYERLARIAPEVVVLRDIPHPDESVPNCLSDHPDDSGACAFPRAGNVRPDQLMYDAEVASLAGGDTVTYLDPTAWVCSGDPCPAVSPRGIIIFRDQHHMTATFARGLSERLADAIAPLVRRA